MMNSSVVEYEKRSISNAIRTAPVKATISSAEQIQPLMKALMSTIVPSELSSDDSDSPLPVTIQTPQDTAYNHHKPIYKPMTIFTESEASVESERYNQTASIHPSEDPDMMQRGQWQRHQIALFCQKHGLSHLNKSLPSQNYTYRNEVYRHIIYDKFSKNLFCFMPKVGCTNMRSTLLIHMNAVPPYIIRLQKKRKLFEKKMEQALLKTTFLDVNLTDSDKLSMMSDYSRFTIVRHPLERLLSAYRDKLEKPLLKVIKPFDYFEHLKHIIMDYYHHNKYMEWNTHKYSASYDINVSFATYVRWIVENSTTIINEHFISQYQNCEPCRFDYHFYGNFRNFTEDATSILKQFGTRFKLIQPSYYTKGKETSTLLFDYYSRVPLALRRKLYLVMNLEFDFYHHLYPLHANLTDSLLTV
jgi:hypothetical protein